MGLLIQVCDLLTRRSIVCVVFILLLKAAVYENTVFCVYSPLSRYRFGTPPCHCLGKTRIQQECLRPDGGKGYINYWS